MDWMEPASTLLGIPTDTVNALTGIATALAAAVAAVFAAKALGTWRDEMIGRRKAELAEETLAAIYRLRGLLQWVRNGAAFGNEGSTRQRDEHENEDGARYRDTLFVPIERLRAERDFLSEFQAKHYRFMALFSLDEAKPYEDLNKVIRDVQFASGALIRESFRTEQRRAGPSDGMRERIDLYERQIGWCGEDEDPFKQIIEEAINSLEKTCRKAIVGRSR